MYYLSFDNSVRNTERKPFFESWCSHCGYSQPTGKCFQKQRKYKGNNKSTVNSNNSNDKHIKHKSWKPNMFFRCGSEDHFIANYQKPDTHGKD